MSDEAEQLRRDRLVEINSEPKPRDALQSAYGPVRDTQELTRDFEVVGFAAPFVVVQRRSDGVRGSLEFQHRPRFYFGFTPDQPQSMAACSWCHASNPKTEPICRECGHHAHVARMLCRCRRCADTGGTGSDPEPLTAADLEAALDRLRRRGAE